MTNVVEFNGVTRLDLPVERVITKALEANLKTVVIIGYDEDEHEYFASSVADGADVVWLMERTKYKLISGDYE